MSDWCCKFLVKRATSSSALACSACSMNLLCCDLESQICTAMMSQPAIVSWPEASVRGSPACNLHGMSRCLHARKLAMDLHRGRQSMITVVLKRSDLLEFASSSAPQPALSAVAFRLLRGNRYLNPWKRHLMSLQIIFLLRLPATPTKILGKWPSLCRRGFLRLHRAGLNIAQMCLDASLMLRPGFTLQLGRLRMKLA